MEIRTVGVIGAGVMGAGVAQALAQSGHDVVLIDVRAEQLTRATDEIATQLRFRGLFGGGSPGAAVEPAADILARIDGTTDLTALRRVAFVIENITERWDLKRELYGRIDALCDAACIFAADTSAIPIARIASATSRPDRVIGTHFMNPVPLKPTVEVIRGPATSDATLAATTGLLAAMGKDAIVVRDSPGFVSNRVLMLTVNEAAAVVQDQVASAEDVDRIFTSCFGHKLGPLATADLIGLDTVVLSLEVLQDSFHDAKYQPCPLLRQLVEAGHHGRKTGRGFYEYAV